jgi:hypothetical protein
MPGYNSPRRGTAHNVPIYFFIVLCIVCFVSFCVLYYCHRVSTQLQLTNISYHINRPHYLFQENRLLTKCYWPVWCLRLQEGTPKIVLAYQIGLRLKAKFNNRNTLRFWTKTCRQTHRSKATGKIASGHVISAYPYTASAALPT